MVNIKLFFDKVSKLEGKKTKDLVLAMSDAKLLRDEIAKLLIDLNEAQKSNKGKEEVVKVEITGGTFK
jgi:hypothetical protein